MSWTQTDVSFKKLSNKRITTSTGKGLPEEKGASTLELYLPDIKTGVIPGTPPNATTDVLYYTGAIGQTLVVDTSVPGNLTWFASSGYGNTTAANDGSALSESQRLGNWVSDKYDGFGTVSGAGYEIKVYDKNNNLITKSDNSNWLFDYQTGILVFNNDVNSYGTGISTNGPYRIVGHRYIGPQGIIPASYGGLGFTTYTLGDILVGSGSTFIKLNVGTDNYVLTASSSSASGLTWSPTAAVGITSLNSLSSSLQYFTTGTSGTGFNISSSGSTHTFNIPIAGSGSTGLISTEAQTIAGQKTFTSAIIGDLIGTATTSGFASTALYSHQSGYGITAGLATSSLYSNESGYGITSGFATTASYSYQAGYGITSGFATTASYAYQSGYGLTSGFATTAANLNVVNATSNLAHPIIFGSTASGSGVAVSSNTTISFNPSTFILSTSGLAVTSNTASTSSTTGSLIVSGGVGIGGSLYITSALPSSLSGVVVNNGVVTNGSWAGSTITAFYGGTGYNSYTKGDILVGVGATFIKLSVGADNLVLTANSSSATGLSWSPTAATGVTTLNSLTATQQYFATDTSGSGFNISSSGSTHTFNIPIAGTGATGLVSTLAQSFAGTKTFTGDVVVSSTTGSTAYNTGSLTVYGGLGVSGQLSFNQAALGYTGATNPSMAFIGSTTSAPITLTVLSDNSLIWEGTSGKLFGINNNLSSGWIFNVGDISGLPIIRANADGTIAMAEFTANVGIGLSNPSYKLHVVGDTNLSSGYVYRINGTQVLSASSLGTGVTNSSLTAVGTISTGVWAATAITSYYGGTGFQTYSTGDLLVGAGSTLSKVAVGTNNYALIADSSVPGGIKWASISGFAITNINGLTASKQDLAFGYSGTVPAFSSSGATHTLNIPIAGTGSTGLVSTQSQSFAGSKTFTNSVAITDNTGSGSYTTGALVVSGGVGIGGTLNVQGDLNVQGTFTTINSTTITVADKNIELGVVGTPTDLTAQGGGITLRGGTDKSINWYSGVGWSSSESWNLASGNTYKINGGIVLSATSLGIGITNSNLTALGIITSGTWSATAITALYGGTGLVPSFTVGDILYANTSTTWGRLTAISNAGYVLTSAGSGATPTYVAQSTLSVGLATTATYSHQSGYGITAGFATTSANINVANAASGTFYPVLSNTSSTASGIGASVNGYFSFNAATGSFGATSINILAGQAYSVGGNSVLSATSLGTGVTNSYLTALGTITTGTWSGNLVTAFYGGTGYNSYTKGDILVGAGNTFIKLNVGSDNYVLTASSSTATGLTWSPTAATGLTTLNSLTATQQYFATGTSGSGFNISSSGSTHTFNIPIAGTGSTGLVSTLAQTFTGAKTFETTLTVSATTSSTNYSSGALIVSGGAGFAGTIYTQTDVNIGNSTTGRLFFSQATLGSAGTTVIPSMAFIGATNSPITLSVLADNSLSFDGSSGQLFSINNNLSSGWIFAVNDISGLPLLRANADGTVAMGEFAGNIGIGLSNPSYKLHVAGDTNLSSSYVYRINGTQVLSSSSLGTGVTNSSLTAVGTITTGTWSATAITAFYGGTGNTSYTLGDLLVGAGSTFIKLPVGINSYVLGADSSKPSGIGWTTVTPLTVSDTPPASPKNADLWFNSSDGGLLVYYSDLDTNQWVEIALGSGIDLSQPVHITNTSPSTSTTSGALIVDGGVGVAGTVHATSFSINGLYDQISSTLITSANTANQVALSIDASSYRTAKMIVQVTSGSNYHSQEILMVHDGSEVYMTEYAMINTGAIGSTFNGDISGGNMRFLVSPTNAVTTYKIACTAIRI
jgi:hypothetical protein